MNSVLSDLTQTDFDSEQNGDLPKSSLCFLNSVLTNKKHKYLQTKIKFILNQNTQQQQQMFANQTHTNESEKMGYYSEKRYEFADDMEYFCHSFCSFFEINHTHSFSYRMSI